MKDNELNLYWVNDLPDIRRRVDGAIVNTCEGYVSKHDKMTPQLFRLAVIGNALRVIMKRCGDENLDFPEKGFNGKFLKWIIKASPQSPCGAWCSVVFAVRVGEAILARFDLPASLEQIEVYRVATSPEALPKLQEMASTYTIAEPAEMPRAEEAWDAIQTRMSKGLAGAAAKHNMAFYAGQDPESAMSEATAALFDNVGKLIHESSPSYSRFLEMAFAGKWEAYLSSPSSTVTSRFERGIWA